MRINVAIPEANVSAPVLNAALEAVTRLDETLIENGHPTFREALTQGKGVKWKPEPPGQEHFDHAAIVTGRGFGDCDDLAPFHCASLRVTGEDPGATAIVKRSAPNMWHAVVQRSDGSIDDPSREAGMGKPGKGVNGAWVPLMHAPPSHAQGVGAYSIEARPQLALRPAPAGYQARADLPWHWKQQPDELNPNDYAMAALHTAPSAPLAIVGALDGAVLLGECSGIAKPEHLERMKCFADCADGVPFGELCEIYGRENAEAAHQVVGSFFKNFGRALASPFKATAQFVKHPSLRNLGHMFTDPLTTGLKVAQPLARVLKPAAGLFKFVPGIGPVAATALDIVDRGLPQNFGDFGKLVTRNAASFIPGVGPMISMAQQAIPGLNGEPQWPQMERFT